MHQGGAGGCTGCTGDDLAMRPVEVGERTGDAREGTGRGGALGGTGRDWESGALQKGGVLGADWDDHWAGRWGRGSAAPPEGAACPSEDTGGMQTLPQGGVRGPRGGTPGSGGPALAVQGEGHARAAPSRARGDGGGAVPVPHLLLTPILPRLEDETQKREDAEKNLVLFRKVRGLGGPVPPVPVPQCSARSPVPPRAAHASAAPAPAVPTCEGPSDTL